MRNRSANYQEDYRTFYLKMILIRTKINKSVHMRRMRRKDQLLLSFLWSRFNKLNLDFDDEMRELKQN